MPRFDPDTSLEIDEFDLLYARRDGVDLLARVYRPRAPGPWPALVDVHGGAWIYFDRFVDQIFDRALAASGMVVVALDFRQAPNHRHPAASADVAAGVRFVQRNAASLDAVPDHIGLIGGSTGGHLLLLAALRPDAPEHVDAAHASSGSSDPGSRIADGRVAYALPLWPIADPLARYRYLDTPAARAKEGNNPFFQPARLRSGHEAYFGDEATMHHASIPRLLAAGEAQHLPPIWVAHPELDDNVTVEMSEALVAAYRRAGGLAELEVFRGVGHSFANFPGDDGERCIDRMKDFIARQLQPLGLATRRGAAPVGGEHGRTA